MYSHNVLQHAFVVEVVSRPTFHSTIKTIYPIVKEIICEDAKDDVTDQNELSSWSRAVTSADGTWMTHYHSKNPTFSIRNCYFNGALYCKHLCQKSRDDVIKEELYQTRMNIAVRWLDAL